MLPANKIDRAWSKPISYLKTHYTLLREDAVTPLREAVQKFRKDPQRMDDNDLRIYEQVRLVGLTFTYKGIAARIRFSTARSGRKILWSASKRLTSGKLVALTPTKDEFRSHCMLAIVAARPLQNLEVSPPEIDILFAPDGYHELDPQNSFIMIEASSGYFEAYRHTLRALQKQSQEKLVLPPVLINTLLTTHRFPLAEHICRLDRNVEPPEYLKSEPVINLKPAADKETADAFQNVDVINDWPAAPSTNLDRTQWFAMRNILTKKLAIIQGPPGTGKTHVSKIAVQIMLANRSPDDPPMIIACQTNHALDQLLELLHEHAPNFVRLGGRSTSLVVKKRALFEVRKSEVIEEIAGTCLPKARRDLNLQTMKMRSYLSPILEDKSPLLTADALLERGIISESQLQSLKQGADQWVRSDDAVVDPLESWLGKAVVPFAPVYNDESFGFEEAEEDLELEQLRELEAETGIADEEDVELLKGEYVALNMGMTMGQPTPQTVEQAKRMLDTAQDLYRVPEHLRGAMYLVMQTKLRARMRTELHELAQTYNGFTTQIQIGSWEKDIAYLSKAPIIGMTTTGLSKYRALVSALKPKIVLIEEAAEVLEGPVSVACVESLEHLILVGDHQQLQANCSVKGLQGEPFHLNISMFERLVRNGIPHRTLLRQRRMAPEFRELIAKSYPELEDHESVVTRTQPQYGMGAVKSWFFNHEWHEMQDEHMSTYNEQEARMIAKFYRHLIRNGVPAASITILTFYNGQRKKILRELKNEVETASIYNKVKTVDSYQGEENMIVLLSLVRNNTSGKIGFLDINNRIVVALSRAKYGFFLFGNGGFLADHNELWDYVEEHMYRQQRSSARLPLTCFNHGRTVWVQYPEDFDRLDGGCDMKCDGVLLCGHKCPLKCHVYPHEEVLCHLPCGKELVCGHLCPKTCKDACGCNCEAYRLIEEDANGGPHQPASDHTQEWREIADQKLTVENVLRIPEGISRAGTARVAVDAEDGEGPDVRQPGQVVRPDLEERSRVMGNGRVRYEEQWQPQVQATQDMGRMSLHDSDAHHRQSVREGKRPEKSTRQPRRPSNFGFDGAYDDYDQEAGQQLVEEQQASLLSWDSQVVHEDKAVAEWVDAETLEWERQQRAARDDSFW